MLVPAHHLLSSPTRRSSYQQTRRMPRVPATGIPPPNAFGSRAAPASPTSPNSSPEAARSSDRKSTRLNSSHLVISYAVSCLKKKNIKQEITHTSDRISVLQR